MSEPNEPLTTDDPQIAALSHRRILLLMAGVVLVGSVLASVFGGSKFGVGVLVGGIMAFGNYLWQWRSTNAIFARAVEGEMPFLPALRYVLRYIAIGLVIWFFHATGLLPVIAVIAGLGAFAMAIVFEGLIGIFSINNRRES